MDTDNCAIVTPDVISDIAWLVDGREAATPIEFHALNSLVEAVVFHETIYVYHWPTNLAQSDLYKRLIEHGIIHSAHSPAMFENELEARNLTDVSRDVLLDRTYGNQLAAYHPKEGVSALSALIDYEKFLGFARMSKVRDQNEDVASFFANALNFNRKDLRIIDDTYRRARAFAACATELNLEMYTGLVNRPFLLGFLSARRRGSLALSDQMKPSLMMSMIRICHHGDASRSRR